MKNIFRLFFSLLCLCLLGGCSEKEETGEVRLMDGTKANQTIYADDTSDEGNGIRFSTDGPWVAEVVEGASTRDSDVSWVRLSRYGGDAAGDYVITVSITPNYTGADRTAYIRIVSGTSTLTITVLQKATTKDGDLPMDTDRTYDGKPAYATFDTDKIELPALPDGPFVINFHTNMLEPMIQIVLPGLTAEEEEIAAVVDWLRPDEANRGECELTLDVFPNKSGKERQATLKFMRNDESLVGSVLLVQAPGAQCQLIDSKATVGSLLFKFSINEQTKFVRYVLSGKRLSQNELDATFLDHQRSSELALTEGQTTFDLTFDNLIPATAYYLYLRPLDKNWVNVGFDVLEEATTAMPESKHDLVLEVSANPANDFTVCLPFSDSNLKGTVDWGDGKTENVEGWGQQGISHTYDVTSSTNFEVRFSGILTNLGLTSDISAARQNTLLAIKQWGYTGLTNIKLSGFSSLKSVAEDTEGAFRGMKDFGVEPYGGSFSNTGIEAIPQGFFDYAVNATSFDDTFEGCSKLAAIPAGLFKNCVKATSFKGTFIGCELVKEIPEDLFSGCTEVTSFWFTFNRCKALETVPEKLFATNTKVTSFEATFAECTNLKTIPAGLFANCPEVLYFGTCASRVGSYAGGSGIFDGCIALQSVPENLFAGNPEILDMSHVFERCYALTALPEKLFSKNTKLMFLEETFLNCKALKNVSVAIFDNNRQLLSVRELFYQCYDLEGESPYTLVGDKKVHLYERADYNTEFAAPDNNPHSFKDCTKLIDYENMPAGWK